MEDTEYPNRHDILLGTGTPEDNADAGWCTGHDTSDEAEARALFESDEKLREMFPWFFKQPHVVLREKDVIVALIPPEGEEEHRVVVKADPKAAQQAKRREEMEERAERRELAMEAGMLHGVDAYNEIMGY
tara:strand:+ start:28979 stop:29371 length:393 start_codon:yes stop_codon:yes gene_type:complete